MAGSPAACKSSSACSQAFHPWPKVPQELQEPDIPWQAGFAETTQDPPIGLQSGKQALRPRLLHVTPCVLFLGVLHARVHGALHRLRATGRGGREATAGWDRPGRCLRHRLHRAISGGLDNHCPLATAPGDAGWPVFVLMAPPGLCRKCCSGDYKGAVGPGCLGISQRGSRTVRPQCGSLLRPPASSVFACSWVGARGRRAWRGRPRTLCPRAAAAYSV